VLINALESKEAMKEAAVNVVVNGFRLRQLKKKSPQKKRSIYLLSKKLRYKMLIFSA